MRAVVPMGTAPGSGIRLVVVFIGPRGARVLQRAHLLPSDDIPCTNIHDDCDKTIFSV